MEILYSICKKGDSQAFVVLDLCIVKSFWRRNLMSLSVIKSVSVEKQTIHVGCKTVNKSLLTASLFNLSLCCDRVLHLTASLRRPPGPRLKRLLKLYTSHIMIDNGTRTLT